MTEKEFQLLTGASADIAADIAQNCTIVEEGPMICPECSSKVEECHLNLYEKLFVCPNDSCEYPFDHNYSVYSTSSSKSAGTGSIGKSTLGGGLLGTSTFGTGSIGTSILETNSYVSASECSDLNQASQAYDFDDGLPSSELIMKTSTIQQMTNRVKYQEDEQHIKKNVEMIKEYNKVLFDGEKQGIIRNMKWIKTLSSMQSSSGMKLVKDHEMQQLKKKQHCTHRGELKIDIPSKEDAMASIVIQFHKVDQVDT